VPNVKLAQAALQRQAIDATLLLSESHHTSFMIEDLNFGYEFPKITTIDDVLPHIQGREEFKVFDKGWYQVVNYLVNFEETFKWDEEDPLGSAIRRECRGLIFDMSGKLISRPYHKFFNLGEKDETQLHKIDLSKPHTIISKLDGSMIRCIPIDNPIYHSFRLATKAGVTEVAMNAEVFIADKLHYSFFINKCIQKGTTPIFEWVSRKNRIIVDYPEDNLILTAIRNLNDGSYVSYEVMKNYAEAWSIPVVNAVTVTSNGDKNLQEIEEVIRSWDKNEEGVVNRFEDGHMFKIKCDDYVLRHRSKDSINQEKTVIALILDCAVDDMIPLLIPEDTERLLSFEKAFWLSLENVATNLYDMYLTLEKGQDQKEFATVEVPSVELKYRPFMFGIRQGYSVRDLIIKQLYKSLSTQTKVNSVRWLFGDISWNS